MTDKRLQPEVVKAGKTRHVLRIVSVVTFLMAVVPVSLSLSLAAADIKTMYVVSDSMKPAFKRGDLIIGSTNFNSLNIGDIVAFNADWFPAGLVTHRIADIVEPDYLVNGSDLVRPSENAKIFTKGDNNNNLDIDPIVRGNITTEIVGVVPYVGYYMNAKVLGVLLGAFLTSSLLGGFDWERFYRKSSRDVV